MRATHLLLAGAALTVLAGCSSVSGGTKAPPATLAEVPALKVDIHKGEFAEIQQFVTPGGVSVWLVSEPSIPILAVNMAWKAGNTSDPEGHEGLSESVAYAMNEGAGDLDSLGFQTAMEDLNMSFGCSTGGEWTSCSVSSLTDNAAASMALVATAFAAPRFDEGSPYERFLREKEISLKTRETNPGYLAWRAVRKLCTQIIPLRPRNQRRKPRRPLARKGEGTHARDDDERPSHRHRRRRRHTGNARPVDRCGYGQPPATSELPEIAPVTLPAVAPLATPSITLPQPQSLVRFTGPGIARADADFFPAFVLNYTVGGGGFQAAVESLARRKRPYLRHLHLA